MRWLAPWLLLAAGGCALVLAAVFGTDDEERTADYYAERALRDYFAAFTSPEREDRYRLLAVGLGARLESDVLSGDDPAAPLRDFLLIPSRLAEAVAHDLAAVDTPPEVAQPHAKYVAAIKEAAEAQERFAVQLRGPGAFEKLFGEVSIAGDVGDSQVVILGEPDDEQQGKVFAFTDHFSGDDDALVIPGLREAREAMAEACRELQAVAVRYDIAVEMECDPQIAMQPSDP